MKIGHVLVGVEAVNAVLYDEGKERKLPFKVKYKLIKMKEVLANELAVYEAERVKLVEEFGSEVEVDGEKTFKVEGEEALKKFYKKLQEVLDTDVEANIPILTRKDLEPIEDIDIDITEEQMMVLLKYLVENVQES